MSDEKHKPSFLIEGKDGKTYLAVTFRKAADAPKILKYLNLIIELKNQRLADWYKRTSNPEYAQQYALAELKTDGSSLPDGTKVFNQTKLLLEIPDNHIYHIALENLF